jgi:hypothetical protein
LITSESFNEDPWGNLAIYGSSKGVKIAEYDATTLTNTTYDINKAGRQWTYQYCTEFGWFQEVNTEFPTRSSSLDAEYWIDYCQRIFGSSIAPPDIESINSYFKGVMMTGKNVYFATASEDPW